MFFQKNKDYNFFDRDLLANSFVLTLFNNDLDINKSNEHTNFSTKKDYLKLKKEN